MTSEVKLAHSLVDWWQLAGVEWDYSETPTDWLADDPVPSIRSPEPPRHTVPATVRTAPEPDVAPPPAAALELPSDLAEFQEAWRSGAFGADGGDGPPLVPHGPVGARIMVITGAPERDDQDKVLSGRAGILLGNIAAAAGVGSDAMYRASYFPRVVLDRRAAAEHAAKWNRIALHHITLVQPEILVVAGEDTARALLGHDPSQKPPVLHFLNHGGGTVKTIVMRKPSLMLHRTAQEKAMAWQSWQLLLVE
ncbi:uracil-DNA glycosylase family protein [Blastomonas sp.]|uniref:uracil-DNA glycosylase family protein n=1 Tax=Blastomonas sp. TaxID=1909299 RepID=UPI002628F376|nr:uracil-DNA glycosylase family protein [Blastomonas sp.]MDM7956283.1 uracil-DNA glycosylase family protein [Blastomonas sp.]